MKSYEIIISGRVQGVGYRYSVYQYASDHGLKGTVRNLSNGQVMIIVQCEPETLTSLERALYFPDSPWIIVQQIQIQEINLNKIYHDFSIVA